jgi:transcriptional regulator with XRE-family HTH domain
MFKGWEYLRLIREQLGLTMRDVEDASKRIAQRYQNEEFLIPISRLSEFETKGITPSIYRLYSLAVIYRRDLSRIMRCYGVDIETSLDIEASLDDPQAADPHKCHLPNPLHTVQTAHRPSPADCTFDLKNTIHLRGTVEQWGAAPFTYLERLSKLDLTYGYIGSEDLTMYPILRPGTFVQVDESLNRVRSGGWRSEHERPIYFVETREGYTCCWCTAGREEIILESHPLSPVLPKVVLNSEAEIIGQVVGIAMRLADWPQIRDSSGNRCR